MDKNLPATGLTLKDAKQYMASNFVQYTIKKTSHLYFGLLIYDVQAIEEVSDLNSLRKRQFRLYAVSEDGASKAWWEATQGPMSLEPAIPEPTFTDGVRAFIRAKVKSDYIKAGELIYSDDEMERATATVIVATKKEKRVVVKRIKGVYSMEGYIPLSNLQEVK
jgi:hypothetical protein